jgi:mRNA-degrading endonuclease toxin of MazEF toxin-antitoxin module
MKRGTLCWVNLEPASPPEFGRVRPALVVSNSEQNAVLETVVVVPLSSQPGEIWPLRLKISLPQGKPSFAVLPGIRQVHKARITEVIGIAAPGFMASVDTALRAYLYD